MNKNLEIYWLSTPIYTIAVDVLDGKVKKTSAIAKWTIGKDWSYVVSYYTKRFGNSFRYEKIG